MNKLDTNFKKIVLQINCLLLIILTLGAIQIQAVIQFETTRSAADFESLGIRPTNLTIPMHPIGSGSNRAIFVGISTQITLALLPANRVVRVTFGPQGSCPVPAPMTTSTCEFRRVNTLATFTSNNQNAVEFFVLVNPPSETRNIEISLLAAGVDYVVAGSASFTGVSQTTPHGTYQQNTGTTTSMMNQPNVNVPDGINGEIIFDTLSLSFNASAIPDMQQTLLFEGNFGSFSDVGAGSMKPDTTSSVTDNVMMSWTIQDAQWALGAIAIKQSVETASPSTISGQAKTKGGEPLKNILIRVENLQTGEVFHTNTNENGFYQLEGLAVTNLYQISAYSNFYIFSPNNRVLDLTESADAVDFQGTKRNRKKWFIRNQ